MLFEYPENNKTRLTPTDSNEFFGGESGIRTHGTLACSLVFKTRSFDRSDISPYRFFAYQNFFRISFRFAVFASQGTMKKAGSHQDFWGIGVRNSHNFSRPPRYDRFDTSPYIRLYYRGRSRSSPLRSSPYGPFAPTTLFILSQSAGFVKFFFKFLTAIKVRFAWYF